MDLNLHPSVIAYRQKPKNDPPESVSREWIKTLAIEAGADDAGVVDIDHPAVQDQKAHILAAFPSARTLISFACRMNAAQLRSTDRALSDSEFTWADSVMPSIARAVIKSLQEKGISAVTPPEGFPQDMSKFPGRMFMVSHKLVAQAAGLGKIGHHRLLIHPDFGSHICLGTIIMDSAVDSPDTEIDFNPCISCGLCVSVCPTGAIGKDGTFDFFTCLVHAYRDRLGGFVSWTEALVTSGTMEEYREKRTDSETLAVWQSLTTGGGYRCGYCMSVCPAGSGLIGPYIEKRSDYIRTVVNPLKDKPETVYVLPGKERSDAVVKRLPNKTAKPV